MADEQLWWNISRLWTKYKHTWILSVQRFILYCSWENWKLNLSLKLLSYTTEKLFSPNKLYKMEVEWSLNLKTVISFSNMIWHFCSSYLANIHMKWKGQELPACELPGGSQQSTWLLSDKSWCCTLYSSRYIIPQWKQTLFFSAR